MVVPRLAGFVRGRALDSEARRMAALMHAYITSDFSVANVVQNSHTDKPLLYKITGVWGNHEGSMLLWIFMLTLCGAALEAMAEQPAPELARA